VALTDGKKEVLMVTALGYGIRFPEDDVRPMGLVAAGVNGIKLGIGDQVTGAAVLPGEGDLFILASDGKAKRVPIKDFPSQGRYGRGVIAWDLPLGVTLAGLALGTGNAVVTIHLRKAAAKSARLDEAGLKKRAAVRGDIVVEVKPGDEVTGLTEPWTVDRFVVSANPTAARARRMARTEVGRRKQQAVLRPAQKEPPRRVGSLPGLPHRQGRGHRQRSLPPQSVAPGPLAQNLREASQRGRSKHGCPATDKVSSPERRADRLPGEPRG
jgi:hypothetical protein